ncbi:hypothetical protein AAVH_31119, partial [Aphelenchoides avenae]
VRLHPERRPDLLPSPVSAAAPHRNGLRLLRGDARQGLLEGAPTDPGEGAGTLGRTPHRRREAGGWILLQRLPVPNREQRPTAGSVHCGHAGIEGNERRRQGVPLS